MEVNQISEDGNSTDSVDDKLNTCPFDPRFPHQNQTKHCFISYIDFQRCSRLLGDYEGCKQLERCYKSLCPNEWINKWQEQIEEGTFPVKLPPASSCANKAPSAD